MLKHNITAFDFAALPDVLKAEYKVHADGSYRLDLGALFVTDKDPAGLLSALESEREEHRKTKAAADRLDQAAKDAKRQAELAELQKGGDLEKLKEFMTQQQEEMKKEFQRQVEAEKQKQVKQQQQVAEQLRQNKAMEIANELFGIRAPLFVPHVLNGIKAIPGDEPRIEILNSAGTPDLTATLESYKKSFLTNPLFEDMIVATKASGGSANDGTKGVPFKKADGTAKGFDDHSPGELVQLLNNNPSEYERLKAAR